jgi:hypothetical protein
MVCKIWKELESDIIITIYFTLLAIDQVTKGNTVSSINIE